MSEPVNLAEWRAPESYVVHITVRADRRLEVLVEEIMADQVRLERVAELMRRAAGILADPTIQPEEDP